MKPVKHSTPVPIKKARIEIIPLIDIMFFLLASFMLVSLSMINMKGVDVNLPTAKAAEPNEKPDLLIDMATLTGAARVALGPELPAAFSTDENLLASLRIRGDEEADPIWPLPLAQIAGAADHSQPERRRQTHRDHIGLDELAEPDASVKSFGSEDRKSVV